METIGKMRHVALRRWATAVVTLFLAGAVYLVNQPNLFGIRGVRLGRLRIGSPWLAADGYLQVPADLPDSIGIVAQDSAGQRLEVTTVRTAEDRIRFEVPYGYRELNGDVTLSLEERGRVVHSVSIGQLPPPTRNLLGRPVETAIARNQGEYVRVLYRKRVASEESLEFHPLRTENTTFAPDLHFSGSAIGQDTWLVDIPVPYREQASRLEIEVRVRSQKSQVETLRLPQVELIRSDSSAFLRIANAAIYELPSGMRAQVPAQPGESAKPGRNRELSLRLRILGAPPPESWAPTVAELVSPSPESLGAKSVALSTEGTFVGRSAIMTRVTKARGPVSQWKEGAVGPFELRIRSGPAPIVRREKIVVALPGQPRN